MMEHKYRPKLPVPASVKGAEHGSFAHHTVAVRLPDIARRVLSENDFPSEIVSKLETLITDIPDSVVRSLEDTAAPDAAGWQRWIGRYPQHNWLDVPWFFAETYFYRRIIEAIGYFQDYPRQGIDPYIHQKQLGLATTQTAIRALSTQLQGWIEKGWSQQIFARLLAIDLWGNQVDLSIWPAGEEGQPSHATADQQQAHLLADDTTVVLNHLTQVKGPVRVDFMIDNAGFELVCDLCLADYLLTSGKVATIVFHLKIHPTFVSDAMGIDVEQTVSFLANDKQSEVKSLAARLGAHLENGRLRLQDHPYWTSSLDGWQMPQTLRHQLAPSSLIISKGDANYRRLLGDRHWDFTTPFADVVSYFPAPLVALRTLKSEVAVGLPPEKLSTLDQKTPHWITSGQWGVIQFTKSG